MSDQELVAWLRAAITDDTTGVVVVAPEDCTTTGRPCPFCGERDGRDPEARQLIAPPIGHTIVTRGWLPAHAKAYTCPAMTMRQEADLGLLNQYERERADWPGGRSWDGESERGVARAGALEDAVRWMAYGYRRRPGYQEEWRP